MADSDVEVVRRGFEAVARRDFEAVSRLLDSDVTWHGAEDKDNEGGCHNRDEALAFIRGALKQGISIELQGVRDLGDRVLAVLQTTGAGAKADSHGELVSVRDGKVVGLVVYATVEEAVAAAAG